MRLLDGNVPGIDKADTKHKQDGWLECSDVMNLTERARGQFCAN